MVELRELECWLTAGQTARELECSVQWVRALLEAGRLRGCRTRLGWLVDPQSLELYRRERGGRHALDQGGYNNTK